MSQDFRGVACIYGAKGTVTIAGTVRGALTSSMDISRPMDHIVKLTDSEGKRKGFVNPETRKRISVTFTPSASSLAGVAAAAALPDALDLLVIASADLTDAEGTYVLDENVSAKLQNTGVQEVQCSGTQYGDASNTTTLAAAIT